VAVKRSTAGRRLVRAAPRLPPRSGRPGPGRLPAAPEPEHTVICAGFTQALSLLCRSLGDRGLERVAVEEPGWATHRLIATQAGLEAVPIGVDEHGLDVESLRASGCETVVVTPAHQFHTDESRMTVLRTDESRIRGEDSPAGIVLGYANLSEPALARAVALLGEAIGQRDRRTPTSSRCANRSAGSSNTR
jgi:DNA-binding transcriptional MocR family regulator